MIVRMIGFALLAGLATGVCAQPIPPPDRAAELMQLQFNSRTTQPPSPGMDGARAAAVYKRFSDSSGRAAPAPAATATPMGAGQP